MILFLTELSLAQPSSQWKNISIPLIKQLMPPNCKQPKCLSMMKRYTNCGTVEYYSTIKNYWWIQEHSWLSRAFCWEKEFLWHSGKSRTIRTETRSVLPETRVRDGEWLQWSKWNLGRDILYLDCSGGYTSINTCQMYRRAHLKNENFTVYKLYFSRPDILKYGCPLLPRALFLNSLGG